MVSFADKDDVLTLLIHLVTLPTTREPRELTFPMKKSVRNFVLPPNEINGTN